MGRPKEGSATSGVGEYIGLILEGTMGQLEFSKQRYVPRACCGILVVHTVGELELNKAQGRSSCDLDDSLQGDAGVYPVELVWTVPKDVGVCSGRQVSVHRRQTVDKEK